MIRGRRVNFGSAIDRVPGFMFRVFLAALGRLMMFLISNGSVLRS